MTNLGEYATGVVWNGGQQLHRDAIYVLIFICIYVYKSTHIFHTEDIRIYIRLHVCVCVCVHLHAHRAVAQFERLGRVRRTEGAIVRLLAAAGTAAVLGGCAQGPLARRVVALGALLGRARGVGSGEALCARM